MAAVAAGGMVEVVADTVRAEDMVDASRAVAATGVGSSMAVAEVDMAVAAVVISKGRGLFFGGIANLEKPSHIFDHVTDLWPVIVEAFKQSCKCHNTATRGLMHSQCATVAILFLTRLLVGCRPRQNRNYGGGGGGYSGGSW